MTRLFPIPAALILALSAGVAGASQRVRIENGRFWIECRDASLPEVLREIAAVVPMEVWLDEGVQNERVSLSVAGGTMKAAVEELFEDTKLNYVLYLDPADAEKVEKIYVGSGGGGRLKREATISDTPPEEPEDGFDPEQFLESPEALEALRDLKSFLERQQAAEIPENAAPNEGAAELDEILDNFPDVPTNPSPPAPAESAVPRRDTKEKEKRPQL